jgi:hypothetical protein
MFCVSCDMFVRSQDEASAIAIEAAPATCQQATPDHLGRQQTPPPPATSSSPGKQEAAARPKLHSPTEDKNGSDAVLCLLMDSMKLLATGLKECILHGDLSGQVIESRTKAMKDIAEVYDQISKLNC